MKSKKIWNALAVAVMLAVGAYFGVIGMIVGVPVFAMIITVCNEVVESKLKARGLPTETADYYPAYSLVNPNENHERVTERLFRSIKEGFKKFTSLFKKKELNSSKNNETQENTEKDNGNNND